MSLLRTRWAAIGAAVAITLGAGGIGMVSATVNSGNRTVFVPITPCRIMDTRPAFAVGSKILPLGPEETYTVDAHGTHGRCALPNDASGLVLNVTATDATLGTFLAIWGDGDRPDSSALNPSPGQPPTPNAVTTDLTDTGRFKIFNKAGTVNVFVDVVGYYANHNHDDRYYTKAQIDDQPGSVEWINVQPQATIRSTSAGLDGATVVRPPGEPAGFYCIKFPAGADLSGEAAIGSIQQSTTLTEGRTISVTTIWANSCFVTGVAADVAVEVFDSNDVRTDSGFVVFVPRGFP